MRRLIRASAVLLPLAILLAVSGGSAIGGKHIGNVLVKAARGEIGPAERTVEVKNANGTTTTVTKISPWFSAGTLAAAQEALGIGAADQRLEGSDGSTDFSPGSNLTASPTGADGGPKGSGDQGKEAEHFLGMRPNTLGCSGRLGNADKDNGKGGGDDGRGRGNVRVNQDCTFRRNAEEDIAFNPLDPDNLNAGANDSRTGYNQCSFAWSTNNGKHWGDEIPPFRQKQNQPAAENPTPADPNRHTIRGDLGTEHTYDADSDPTMAFDAFGRAYFGCVAFDVTTNASLLWASSSPPGAEGSFYFNLSAHSRRFVIAEDNSAEIFHDKEFITADIYRRLPNGQTNPRAGNAYMTWTVFRFSDQCVADENPGGYCESPIFGSMTTDAGLHWSTPEVISGSAPGVCTLGNAFDPLLNPSDCNQDQGSDPVVLPNGDLVVTFQNANGPGTTLAQALAVHCSPAGNSATGTAKLNCAPPHRVAKQELSGEPTCDFGRGPEECVPGAYIRTNAFPRIGVNRENSHVYVTWQDYLRRDNGAKEWSIQLAKSVDGGNTWTGPVTINPDTGLDHYFPAIDLVPKGEKDRVGVSYYRTERVPNEANVPAAGFAPCPGVIPFGPSAPPPDCQTGVGAGNSDYVLAGGTDLMAPYEFKVLSPVFPPPNGIQAGFNGDYSGLVIPKGDDAHPIWSDTRNVDPYAPANGVVNDEDVFTDNVGLPNGRGKLQVGRVGKEHGEH